jgi:hypothetical protein
VKRVALVAFASLAALVVPAGAASWHGGAAPNGIRVEHLVVESDGSLVASRSFYNAVFAAVGSGASLLRQPASGLGAQPLVALDAVAGGLRAVDEQGALFASTNHGATWASAGQIGDVGNGGGGRDAVVAWGIDPLAPARALRVHLDGGVQRSPDGGRSWFSGSPLQVPDGGDGIPDGSARFAPDGSVYVHLETKLWRSADLADTWATLPAAPRGNLVVSPAAAGALWIAGAGGVFRSVDGGATWQRRLAASSVVIASPVDSLVAWSVEAHGVKLTVDGGVTWRSIAGAPPIGFEGVVGVALHGAARSMCLAAARGIWCSDAGGSFVTDRPRVARTLTDVAALALDAQEANHAVAIAGRDVWETTDGSLSWHPVAAPPDDYASVEVTKAGTFLAGSHGVLFRARVSSTWTARAGPTGRTTLAADPRTGIVFARSRGSLWRATAGRPFHRVAAVGMRVPTLTPGSVGGRGRTLIASSDAGVKRISTDGGATFRRLSVAPPGDIVVSPTDPRRLVVATHSGIFVSSDTGRTWRRTARATTEGVAADPHHSGRWYAGSLAGAVSISIDNGRSWHPLTPRLPLEPAPVPGATLCCQVRAAAGRVWATRFLEPGVWWRRVGA